MGWQDDEMVKLKVEDVEDNVAQRTFYKLLMNALLGKFAQDSTTKKSTVSVSSQKDLDELFWKEDVEIASFVSMSDYVAEVNLRSKTGFNKPNRKANSVIVSSSRHCMVPELGDKLWFFF
jgi:hypothetical protein